MLTAEAFAERLFEAGYDFFSGVPCSLLAGLIDVLERRALYVAAPREDAALGLAAGAALAGRLPAVLMQNSGLAGSLGTLASLQSLYRLPCLLLVSWRGCDGRDAPEHLLLGRITPSLLEACEVPHRTPSAEELREALEWAGGVIREGQGPVALVLRRGVLGQ